MPGLFHVEFVIDSRTTRAAVWAHDYLEVARATSADVAEAEAGIVVAAAAEQITCDVVATQSAYLLSGAPRSLVKRANPVSPEDAAALVGLYLRLDGDFSIDYGKEWKDALGRHFSYFVLMRELLPAAWRWFSGCMAHSASGGDEDLAMIAQSGMERVDRALRARDRLHGELQQPSGLETIEEALFYFDVTLLMLGGAFDVTALVADAVHGLNTPPHRVSWASTDWLRKTGQTNQTLARLMIPGQPSRDARELVAVLRNTIHGQSMGTISYQASGRPREQLIVLPKSVESKFEQLIHRQPHASAFGVERLPSQHLSVDPGCYIEALFPRALAALSAIMDATPVERLAGVDATKLMTGPPQEETFDNIFHPAIRKRLRLLAGFA
jgi:hypothetical protein